MPTINPTLIPLVTPGNTFSALTENESLAIRYLIAQDPHFFDVYNRPLGDITVRQLILAKSLDQLGLRLSHQANFPFLISATVNVATNTLALPISWIWDMHVSIPDTWENLRLARIQRYPGDNNATSSDVTGIMRFVFTASAVGSTTETGMFYVDYEIDSTLTYQIRSIKPATISEDSNPLPSNQHQTIAGFVIFKTIDINDNIDFLTSLAPPSGEVTGTASTQTPNNYEITSTVSGGVDVDDDFSVTAVSHGTGELVSSAYNVIPPIGVDENSVLSAIGYPWQTNAVLTSNDLKSTIPTLLFNQFSMSAPTGDRSATLEEPYPVILTRIRRLDVTSSQLQFVFSTYNTIIGSSSNSLIEFASVTLPKTGAPDDIYEITPLNNLKDNVDAAASLFFQNFGSGYVKLSSEWATNSAIVDFFDSFTSIVDEPADRAFSAQLNEFALQRSPSNGPTIGESQALVGSTTRRKIPLPPSDDNRYVNEQDQGLGDEISLTEPEFTTNTDISPSGYSGSLLHKSITLAVNTANNAKFNYNSDILPRLKKLLGRNPIHGDEWFDGTTFKRYDGLSKSWIG